MGAMHPSEETALAHKVANICAAMRDLGLITGVAAPTVVPLAGGVSSDVFRVDLREGPICVKQALARLKVSAQWEAPVERVHNEAAWLRFAGRIDGRRVPRILAEDRRNHLFAMTYFDPGHYPVWKSQLRDGVVDLTFASAVGDAIGAIHAASAGSEITAKTFATGDLFMALRIEPYLLHTAKSHPDRAGRLGAMARDIGNARIGLMHGDVSPKNILRGPEGPVFLDAETACYGDPAFDLAFCLNHLLLKCIWVRAESAKYCAAFSALKDAYFARVDWEDIGDLDIRAAGILGGLLLARIDGKSPVEYITGERDKAFVRAAAREFLTKPSLCLDDMLRVWQTRLSAQ